MTMSRLVKELTFFAALFAGVIWLTAFMPTPELDRRQFMAECTTARGSDDGGFRACLADWPLHEALHASDWKMPGSRP